MTDRMRRLSLLVDEVTKDEFDKELVKKLAMELGIDYTEDQLQLLNNILKGIHAPETPNEQEI